MAESASNSSGPEEPPKSLVSQLPLTPGSTDLKGAERALRAATLFFRDAKGFHLCAAIFGNPLRREYWIERLRENLAIEEVKMTVLSLQSPENPRLLNILRTHLNDKTNPEKWGRCVSVIELERHLPNPVAPRQSTNPFLAQANLDRELFVKVCPVPLLLWLTPTDVGFFAREAPDLWHWRAHVF